MTDARPGLQSCSNRWNCWTRDAIRVVAWLSGTSRPWLIVFDDLRDAADREGLWPVGTAGRAPITAANAAAVPGERGVRIHAVPTSSTREALSYLAGRLTTDPDQRGGAIDLAADLGCDPAALAQPAAVTISLGVSCRDYREYFVQRPTVPVVGGELPAVWFTWTAAASHAERLTPGAGTPIAARHPGPATVASRKEAQQSPLWHVNAGPPVRLVPWQLTRLLPSRKEN